jgi:hypothetical protein
MHDDNQHLRPRVCRQRLRNVPSASRPRCRRCRSQSAKLELLRSGKATIVEEGIQELKRTAVQSGRLRVTDDSIAAVGETALSLSLEQRHQFIAVRRVFGLGHVRYRRSKFGRTSGCCPGVREPEEVPTGELLTRSATGAAAGFG